MAITLAPLDFFNATQEFIEYNNYNSNLSFASSEPNSSTQDGNDQILDRIFQVGLNALIAGNNYTLSDRFAVEYDAASNQLIVTTDANVTRLSTTFTSDSGTSATAITPYVARKTGSQPSQADTRYKLLLPPNTDVNGSLENISIVANYLSIKTEMLCFSNNHRVQPTSGSKFY